MRPVRIILLAAAILMAAGLSSCRKDNGKSMNIAGEWHLVSDSDGIGGSDVDVYVSFGDSSFELFQKSGTAVRYSRYSGTYSLADGFLTGKYSGGSAWASDYSVVLEGNDVMTMTAVGTKLVCTYQRTSIPSEIRSSSIDTKSVSGNAAPEPLL